MVSFASLRLLRSNQLKVALKRFALEADSDPTGITVTTVTYEIKYSTAQQNFAHTGDQYCNRYNPAGSTTYCGSQIPFMMTVFRLNPMHTQVEAVTMQLQLAKVSIEEKGCTHNHSLSPKMCTRSSLLFSVCHALPQISPQIQSQAWEHVLKVSAESAGVTVITGMCAFADVMARG